MTYGFKSNLKSYMILGSNKSWAELDYTVINLLKFLFQNCLNNFLILWWLLFSQLVLMIIAIFPYISLYTVWKIANLPTGKSIVHNAAHSFMDYVNIWSNHTIFCCSKSQWSNKVNSIMASDVTYQYMFSRDLAFSWVGIGRLSS